jgi:hypothetical protein
MDDRRRSQSRDQSKDQNIHCIHRIHPFYVFAFSFCISLGLSICFFLMVLTQLRSLSFRRTAEKAYDDPHTDSHEGENDQEHDHVSSR